MKKLFLTAKDNVEPYKIHFNVIILCSCLVFLSMNTLAGTIYYVSTCGSNNNNGTSEISAWQTIQKAATTATAGDTVYIEAGDYGNENVIFANDGTVANPIVFEGYKTTPGDNPTLGYTFGDNLSASDMPLLDGGNRATAGTALNLNGHNYITLKNIQIENYNTGVYGYSSEYCIIENIITIELGDQDNDYDGKGIVLGTYGNNNLVKRCIIANACAEGISVTGNTNTIEDCQVYCDDDEDIDAAMDYYIVVVGNYNTIIGCYAERVGDLPHGGHGISLKGNCEYNLVKDCMSSCSTSFGVRQRSVRYNIFENCIAFGGEGDTSGLTVRDGASHNTFRNCRTIGVTRGVRFFDSIEDDGAQSAGSYNIFENCIFEDTTDSCISFFYYSLESSAFDNDFINCTFYEGNYLFECDRSNFGNTLVNCIVTGVSQLMTGSYALSYSSSYSDFYNNGFATPAGVGNFSSNPLFTDAGNGDFRLRPNSPCIDAGTTVNVDFDYNYLKRLYGSYYDVGAHECNYTAALANLKLDENTGTATEDEMANISEGTVSGAIWVTGRADSALDFDGINDYVSFGTQSALELSGSRTISAWVKPEQHDQYNVIAAKDMWGSSLFCSGGNLRGYVAGSTTGASSRSNESLSTGSWQHVAMTFDVNGDKKIHLYIDGNEVTYSTQQAMVGSPTSNIAYNFCIGSHQGTNYWFNGMIDEVKIFKWPLNAQAVFNDYATVFAADFNIGAGSVVDDVSIGNSDSTIDGANWVAGISGRALDFDGIDDYVNCGNPLILELSGSRTISAWVKPEQHDQYNVIAAKDMWGSSLFCSIGNLRGYVAGSTTGASSRSNESISTGRWQHVAMTFDVNGDKKIHLYIDGDEVTYATQQAMVGSPTSNAAYNFCIGSHEGTNYWFNGVIDKVRVFAQPLNALEIFDKFATIFAVDFDINTDDTSINAVTGINNGASWVAGITGEALDFNGSSDYVNYGNPLILELSGSRTISAWVKPEQHDQYNVIAAKNMWGSGLFCSGGNLRGYVAGSTTGASSRSNESLSTGSWQHVAMTFDVNGDKKIHLYINGDEVTYSTQQAMVGNPTSTAAYNFCIGSDRGVTYWFNGVIDEVKVYIKALTPSEVESVYEE